ncbi:MULTISPECIES: hypothetical protein [unclassified Cellvibrio]|nr:MULTISPECIES: hypothetical protein [unclassified Cellvibrio]UUA73972.1 hypothetical protein NNX04_05900 [Cellvibrio sp. QJXJ]
MPKAEVVISDKKVTKNCNSLKKARRFKKRKKGVKATAVDG